MFSIDVTIKHLKLCTIKIGTFVCQRPGLKLKVQLNPLVKDLHFLTFCLQ